MLKWALAFFVVDNFVSPMQVQKKPNRNWQNEVVRFVVVVVEHVFNSICIHILKLPYGWPDVYFFLHSLIWTWVFLCAHIHFQRARRTNAKHHRSNRRAHIVEWLNFLISLIANESGSPSTFVFDDWFCMFSFCMRNILTSSYIVVLSRVLVESHVYDDVMMIQNTHTYVTIGNLPANVASSRCRDDRRWRVGQSVCGGLARMQRNGAVMLVLGWLKCFRLKVTIPFNPYDGQSSHGHFRFAHIMPCRIWGQSMWKCSCAVRFIWFIWFVWA